MTETAWIEGMKELLMLPSRDQEPITLEFLGKTYRKYLDCLTDRQWRHAVDETMRHDKWFPAVAALLERGDSCPAPVPRLQPWDHPVCPLCEGSGFEAFERGGYAYVRFCGRGCKVGEFQRPADQRTDEEAKADARRGVDLCKRAYERAAEVKA